MRNGVPPRIVDLGFSSVENGCRNAKTRKIEDSRALVVRGRGGRTSGACGTVGAVASDCRWKGLVGSVKLHPVSLWSLVVDRSDRPNTTVLNG
jgi:hypothetical protein